MSFSILLVRRPKRDKNRRELYHLEDDPTEMNDFANENPLKVEELEGLFKE
jgi:hypothetical protein